MSETREPPSNVTPISEAFKKAKPVARKKKADAPAPASESGGGRGEIVTPPTRLPPNAPVTALGRCGTTYYFLDSQGQYVSASVDKLGRLFIIGLFGGEEYLIAHWRTYDRHGTPKDEFDHGKLGPVLIASCAEKPIFDPVEQVRGRGAWHEEDGTLVMHCGDWLYTAFGRCPTGLRRGYLYPAAPAMIAPDYNATTEAARIALRTLDTWTWARGSTDAKLALGWIAAAMLGGAPDWRPMVWITGGRGSGKSTFQKLIRWLLGPNGLVRSENATRAFVFQRIGNSSLPVALDEFESEQDNRKRYEIIELARAASSGGVIGRGGADGQPTEFTARNPFAFSSIGIPPLEPADRSRMAILELMTRTSATRAREPGEDDSDDLEDGEVLGAPETWHAIGAQLRGLLLKHWRRYGETFRAYRRALMKGGHSDRAADQFASLGAAYDLVMFEALEDANVQAWARMLPAGTLAETADDQDDPESCLHHLLTATADLYRHGQKEPVGAYVLQARREAENGNVREADEMLQKIGIKVFRDNRVAKNEQPLWWIAVMNNHRALAGFFEGSKWGAKPGLPGAWSQMLRRIEGAFKTKLQFAHRPMHCVAVPWDAAFPPDDADLEEDAIVDARDRK